MSASPSSLLRTRRFLPLLITQTLGAFNDNLFKNALVVMALFQAGQHGPMLVALAGGVFILPYALFSAAAGQLADRYDKGRLIRITKAYEVVLMAAAAAGFFTGSLPLLMLVLFGLGAQATFFSPLKYGILPDHLRDEELVAGNGLIEAGTFLGIVGGTVAGGALFALEGGPAITSAVGFVLALIGMLAAWAVPAAPSAAPDLVVSWNIPRETKKLVTLARPNRPVWLSILGLSWFWTIGAIVLTELPILSKEMFLAGQPVLTLLLAVFAIGVGIGSILCAKLLNGEVSARFVPFAAIGISLFAWDFASTAAVAGPMPDVNALIHSVRGWRMLIDLALLAACGGLYSVPLYAILQEMSAPEVRSRMVACNNIINAAFMVLGALAAAALPMLGLDAAGILIVAAIANLLVALWIAHLLPQEVFRTLFRAYFKSFHHAEVKGLENALALGERSVVVVNHLSFLDGCFLASFLPGSPVFAIDTDQAKRFWYLKYLVDFFPVDPTNPMSTKAMIKAVKEGRHLVIFPEGRITLTGALMKIYDGPGTIADKADAEILPVRIEGLQLHKFSRMEGKLRQRWFPRISMTILPPRKSSIDPDLKGKKRREALTRSMQDIMSDAAFRPEGLNSSLFGALLTAKGKFDTGKIMAADALKNEVTYSKLILGATVLGAKLAKLSEPGERVGVLLPNSVGVVATFFGLQAYGRVPAMLNFSAGADNILSACSGATIRTVLTSRAFIEKGKLDKVIEAVAAKVQVVYLEDIRKTIGTGDKLSGLWKSRFPRRLPGASSDPSSPAVVLFTSGSEGTPKGVVLSHANILANCAQIAAVADLNPSDKFFNALPVFHSFGLTGGTILPLLLGIRTFLYPSPLHYKLVPELAYAEQSTVLFGTDSFLAGYARMGRPQDFQSMRFIVAGAERVKDETRKIFWEKFQKAIYEGYGVTECSPVLAVNTPAHFRSGTVGRFLPAIQYRLEDVPGIDKGGRLYVRGPNIMLGYLKAEAPGLLQEPEEGWYDTGDIVSVDEDGFVTIQGRAKRFAKIAGEMVSLAAAEMLANDVWPSESHAVIALPDPRKGEQLVLVTTRQDATAKDLLAKAREKGIAEIMVPRNLKIVDKLPLLGTGKTDYPALSRMGADWAAKPTPETEE
ncbi:acyl-[ACP]--phospholipid O-acyltransferase [Lacibacterium aquatile]|uniref:Acyl-[ACP]--phospholipid O-acyltransferase n=1 Tax=Lacibacterium aquatile TaxID=1168082 RepID=A0ABW5DV59_9PROT